MLRFSEIYNERDILSLRTGSIVGHAYSPIINPNNLKIEGWYAAENGAEGDMILPVAEVREVIDRGFIVNDHSAITPSEDLVRMSDITKLQFELIGKTVKSDMKRKLGKVHNYAVDESSMIVQKMYVTPGALRGITKQDLVIDRSQIVEINNREIIVRDATERVGAPARAMA